VSSERLYYTDPYLVEFDAVVREAVRDGDRWKVTLDRTAFYPTSGGQPFDTGTIAEAQVLDVVDQEDGTVAHIVDRELEKNCRVRAHVNWERRFDHMQQHTGQHLLSAAFEREVSAKTVSFHLGTASSTIDLDRELSAQQIARVEETANRVLWEDREVCIQFLSAHEAAKLPLRKEPARTGELRIIEIKDYDVSACGGTHVRRTGAIGIILITATERFKGGLRVEFVCGNRALATYRSLKSAVDGSVRVLSVTPEELPSAIERLQTANKGQQKAQEGLFERLAVHEAASMSAAGEKVGGVNVVATAVSGWDVTGLKKLASAIVSRPATAAVLLTTDAPSPIVVARSSDLAFDAGAVLRQIIERFGGKGGGKGALAQGGGISAKTDEVLAAAKDYIKASA